MILSIYKKTNVGKNERNVAMDVSVVSGNCNASYPKYLEKKQKQGIALSLIGVGTTASSYLIKNNKLGIGTLLIGLVTTLGGLLGSYSASKKMNAVNTQIQPQQSILKQENQKITPEQHAINALAIMTPGGNALYGKNVNFNKTV